MGTTLQHTATHCNTLQHKRKSKDHYSKRPLQYCFRDFSFLLFPTLSHLFFPHFFCVKRKATRSHRDTAPIALFGLLVPFFSCYLLGHLRPYIHVRAMFHCSHCVWSDAFVLSSRAPAFVYTGSTVTVCFVLCYRACSCCSGKQASFHFPFSRAKFQRKLIVVWYSKDAGVSSFALANPKNVGVPFALKSISRLTSICPRPFEGTQEGVPVTTCEVLCAA